MKNRRTRISSLMIAAGVALAATGAASSATAAPVAATGAYTLNNGFGVWAGVVKGFSPTVNLTSPLVDIADTKGIFVFCVDPGTDFNLDKAYNLTTTSNSALAASNPTAPVNNPTNVYGYMLARYLLAHVTYYGPLATAMPSAAPAWNAPLTTPALGSILSPSDPTKVLGTAITAGVDSNADGAVNPATVGDFYPVDLEYAAFQAAIRKLIDNTTDLTTIANTQVKTRATALYSLAVGADGIVNTADDKAQQTEAMTLMPAKAPYAVEILPVAANGSTNQTAKVTASFKGASGVDGAVTPIVSLPVVLSTTDLTMDMDLATAGIQTTVNAAIDASGALVDSAGKVGVEVGRPTADAVLSVKLAKAIAPGTLVTPVDPTSPSTKIQTVITSNWAAAKADVSISSKPSVGAVTPTTAAPTKLPNSGPVTSLPLLLMGTLLGAAGLIVRRRQA